MRLKVQHKEDLYNLIVGKLKPNLTVSFEDAEKYINEKLYAIFPPEWKKVNDYIAEFLKNDPNTNINRHYILLGLPFINEKGNLEYKYIQTCMPLYVTTQTWAKNYGFFLRNISISQYSPIVKPISLGNKEKREVKDASVADWFNDNFINPMREYETVCSELRDTIYSCNTDKQLKELYPEFEKYFTIVGITPVVSNLPTVYGLPDKLKKFGY